MPSIERVAPSRLAHDRLEAVATGHRRDVDAAHIGLRRKTISHDPPVLHARQDRLHLGMIEAQHRRAVEGHMFDELHECVLDPVEVAVMVEMLGIDVGDDRDGAVEPQEGTVGLIGLDHHPLALALARVRAVAVDDPAVDHGRIDPAGVEQRGDHRGRRRLAVGAGDRDAGLEAHQFGEHFGAAHHRNPALQREIDLGIAALDRGRGHDDRGVAEILRAMTDRDVDPFVAQALHDIAVGDVGALHDIAEVLHHLGDTGHADPADADEMNRADVGRDTLHAQCRLSEDGRSSICDRDRRHDRRAADPLDQVGEIARRVGAAAAPCARGGRILVSALGSSASFCICLPSSTGVKRIWRIIRAPPAATISRALAVWWSSVALGSGTRIAGRPAQVSSAMVEAPARAMTRCAQPSRSGMSSR